eukprot:m.120933 g.120933  ORF g.120933 m.120933 type:complete len:79 (-) comp12918_c0_seq3:1541-1777(-)
MEKMRVGECCTCNKETTETDGEDGLEGDGNSFLSVLRTDSLLDEEHQQALVAKRLNSTTCPHYEGDFFVVHSYDFCVD